MAGIMWKSGGLLLAMVLVAGPVGCRSLDGPNWSDPGTAWEQRARALKYDPFPENEPAPQIVGSRPRGYEDPIPETPRIQWDHP